jgi:predicted Zn-dependent protease
MVYVIENGKPVERLVEIGIQGSTYAEVKSGLQAGEQVATSSIDN